MILSNIENLGVGSVGWCTNYVHNSKPEHSQGMNGQNY